MKLIAKKDININGIIYNKGDEIENINKKEDIIKLNERGFIEPLTMKDIQNFGKKEEKPKYEYKKNEKEE